MGNADYQSGLGAGYARSRALQNEYESKIAEWRNYSESLKSRIAVMQAQFDANNHVLGMLLDELIKSNPGSPLLIKENRDSIRRRVFDSCMSDDEGSKLKP